MVEMLKVGEGSRVRTRGASQRLHNGKNASGQSDLKPR